MTIYRSALINRRPGLTQAEFRDHWIRVHGGLAAQLPGLGSYRQNHLLERIYEAPDVPVQSIDGISQLSFDSIAAMEVSDASPEYARVKADIPLFQAGITILVLQSEELLADRFGAPPAAKLLWLSGRREGICTEDLRQRCVQAQREAAPRIPGARRFVQNFVVDRGHPVQAGVPAGDASAVEALSELWFDDEAALRAALHTQAAQALIHSSPLLTPIAVYRIEEIHIV